MLAAYPKYRIHRNFCEEKNFANFTTCSGAYWQNFYHANFLSCCIEDIATLTTLAKISRITSRIIIIIVLW